MDSITTLIVEDEPMLAEILVDTIKQFPQFNVIGIADKLESAKKNAASLPAAADPVR
ncbi:transcriptional regulatory protein CitB [Klebsiella aerogenes UCI 48]|nr:transcriptional regulatory protein CitB [Klebsiella aerogenes UCI 48]EUL53305.1 transcriptional regulatory protein CitB [Klebsiella aerogenes UCI 47]